jgi:hypothetical protein
VDISSPEYRAKRQLPELLKCIDARLVPFACSMVDAAAEVMEHEARSPWGWVVYYSEAHCFAPAEVVLRLPADDPDNPPPTPPMPSRPGSTGSDGNSGPSTDE